MTAFKYGFLSHHVEAGHGGHFTMDLFECPKDKLSSQDFITRFLDQFPGEIEMHKVSEPSVFPWEDKDGGRGLSGVVLITESHITVHTFPEKGMAFVDVFSTKDFNLAFASNYIANYFESTKYEVSKIGS